MTLAIEFFMVGFICLCLGGILAFLICADMLASLQERPVPVMRRWSD